VRSSILGRLFHRTKTKENSKKLVRYFERLEDRTLLSGATVTAVAADNRGQVQITLSAPILAADVNTGAIQMYTAGHDKIIGTADDVQISIAPHYSPASNRITVVAALTADIAYRVKLVATRLRDANGTPIDGEFTGTFPSGNHKAGGNFEFQVKNDKSATPIARFSTSLGTMDVTLFRGTTSTNLGTPKNVTAFLNFADAGDYDNIFVTRDAKNFVVQMGGLKVSNQNQVVSTPGLANGKVINGEPGNSNITGTVAFALAGGPNTADNEFFFNLANNDGRSGVNLNDNSTGGGPFTVFGVVANSRSFAILTAINNLNRLNLSSTFGSLGSLVDNVPVNSDVPVTGQTSNTGGSTSKTLNPTTDFVLISRVALLMKVAALT
jgi:cyclophilin family peptidyl-prolyl cis-trans isomerase